MLTLGSL
jgi:pimeloyl-ACP methyl ester carboxylesterase